MAKPSKSSHSIDLTKLFPIDEKEYGSDYREHLLKQYMLLINMADNISSRRALSNSFYLGINAFLLTVLGLISIPETGVDLLFLIWTSSVAIAGIAICFIWRVMILSYKDLNSAKYEVINTIEMRLPVAGYSSEWVLLKSGGKYGKHKRFTNIESRVPKVFSILYITMALGIIGSFLIPIANTLLNVIAFALIVIWIIAFIIIIV